MSTELLSNYLGGQWQVGQGSGTPLLDPVLGTELVRVDATGLDLAAGFEFARTQAGAALRAMTYRERGAMLAAALTETGLGKTMGVLAVALAAVNVFGGFLVTRRMLEMFKKKDKKPAKGEQA